MEKMQSNTKQGIEEVLLLQRFQYRSNNAAMLHNRMILLDEDKSFLLHEFLA